MQETRGRVANEKGRGCCRFGYCCCCCCCCCFCRCCMRPRCIDVHVACIPPSIEVSPVIRDEVEQQELPRMEGGEVDMGVLVLLAMDSLFSSAATRPDTGSDWWFMSRWPAPSYASPGDGSGQAW
ncbi:hypothetical protein BCR43DRAFT_489532 [Syncephalastrum racemosum]|uniref:Uncharacterized protein n=1 Tax=Syncephalastrum racemosum TaxID=13706 RepID=A0A1X2HEG2_SYNRA|nr:hypothetical protein BCR43DRAFT_489532 [Syncephalastrum racemosum]